MRFTTYLWVFSIVLIVSCAEKNKQAVFEVVSLPSPAKKNSSLPYLFSNADITLLSWVEKENDSLTQLRYAELNMGDWQPAKDLMSGPDWFVNWADFPSIVENQGNLFSHILKKSSSGTYSYDVKSNLKPKGTKDWMTDIPLHTDGTATEHGFVTALPYRDDSFFVTWLDGRNTEEKEGEERGAMTIRAAVVSPSGLVSNEKLLDPRTCDCCQTTAAITAQGPVVLYRDRSDNEIRDISIVRELNGVWTAPKAVYHDEWKIKGCPVNGPKAAAMDNSLVVVWFTAAHGNPAVKVSFSHDNGANFEEPVLIGTSKAIGRVDIALIDSNTALVSYVAANEKSGQFKVVKVSSKGQLSEERIISEINPSRQTGFPQMELVGDKVYFAWTELTNERTKVMTASVDLDNF